MGGASAHDGQYVGHTERVGLGDRRGGGGGGGGGGRGAVMGACVSSAHDRQYVGITNPLVFASYAHTCVHISRVV